MSLRSILNAIKSDLDSRQIFVTFEETDNGVMIFAKDYASQVIARAELKRRGIIVV